MKYDKETFLNYCKQEIKSLNVAIDRKYRGSTVEEAYFLEHIQKLNNFFLEAEVE